MQKRPAIFDLRVQERPDRAFRELRVELVQPLEDIEPFVEIVDRCGFFGNPRSAKGPRHNRRKDHRKGRDKDAMYGGTAEESAAAIVDALHETRQVTQRAVRQILHDNGPKGEGLEIDFSQDEHRSFACDTT